MPSEKVYCVCQGRTEGGETKCRKRITQGKGSSAVKHVENIRATRDADYEYKEGDRLLENCRKKLVKEVALKRPIHSQPPALQEEPQLKRQRSSDVDDLPDIGLAKKEGRGADRGCSHTCGGSSSSSSSSSSSFLLLLLLQKSPHVS